MKFISRADSIINLRHITAITKVEKELNIYFEVSNQQIIWHFDTKEEMNKIFDKIKKISDYVDIEPDESCKPRALPWRTMDGKLYGGRGENKAPQNKEDEYLPF